MKNPDQFEKMLIFLIALAMAGIFVLDLQTPLGVADAVLYVLPVSATLWLTRRRDTIVSAAVCIVLTVLGYYFSPLPPSDLWVAIVNRGYSVFIILLGGAFVVFYKKRAFLDTERKSFFETIFSDSFDAIIKIDSSGKVIGWNRSSEKVFGWTYDEALGRDIAELIIPQQYRQAHKDGMWRFLATGNRGIINQHIEISALRKDGGEFSVELTVSAISLDKGYVFSAVVRDITQRKRLERENQTYALELGESLKKEKLQRQALEIANANLSHFSKQVELNLLELENAYLQTLSSLSLAAEFKDADTGKHLVRISKYSEILAKAAGLSEAEVKSITLASPMHDIGKVGIPDIILQKKGKLTDPEFAVIRQHTFIGAEILGNSDAPIIVLAREIALSHHEKWDGGGYPNGIAGEDIPITARIVGLVDCFDALTSARPYKNPYPLEIAYDIIVGEEGRSFDPRLVRFFMERFDEFKQMALDNRDVSGHAVPFQLSIRDQVGQKNDKAWDSNKFPVSEPSEFREKND